MKRIQIIMLILAICASFAAAKNIDLVTLPERESVQLTIYNAEDLTLVRETRHITLKKGQNLLQFSWANTLIDPTSVELRPLEKHDQIELAHTIFPGQKPQHLIWNIQSEVDGQVKVEVSYFTSGLTWTMDYIGITNPEETQMRFDGYVRVFNNSGEQYENATIRLIVGEINLVEKIAELARRRGRPVPPPPTAAYKRLCKEAADEVFAEAEERGARLALEAPGKPREVAKEAVGEYFMFTIEGTETVPNQWSKRMIALKAEEVTFKILYRMREYQYGSRPVRFFIWNNDEEHKLGESPLPNGRIRVFRENGRDGLAYLGEKTVRYVPIKGEIEINLGPDDLVVYEAKKMKVERSNFDFRQYGRNERVVGWTETQTWNDEIRNYRAKPIVLELRRIWNGDVDYRSEVQTTLFDYRTSEQTVTVPARGQLAIPHVVTIRHGSRSKQNRVELVK